jgi:hypothetical protein
LLVERQQQALFAVFVHQEDVSSHGQGGRESRRCIDGWCGTSWSRPAVRTRAGPGRRTPPAPAARLSRSRRLLALARPWTEDPKKKEIRVSSPLKRLTRKVFERHSNPWSAWTRLLSTPLVLVPFWTRSRKHAALVGTWMLLNPIVFPKPNNDSAWATRAMLGEEMWVAERPIGVAMAVNVAASAFGIGGVVGALKRRPTAAALCTVAEVASLLVYWQLMSEYYEEHRNHTPNE